MKTISESMEASINEVSERAKEFNTSHRLGVYEGIIKSVLADTNNAAYKQSIRDAMKHNPIPEHLEDAELAELVK